MIYYPQTIFLATKSILQIQAYRFIIVPLALIILALFVAIPTTTIPSNTLMFQFSLYSPQDFITVPLLAILTSLFILMNAYVYRQIKTSKERFGILAKGGLGGVFGTIASIFGAASCPMCIAALFGFLGFGTVGFLARNQWWVFLTALTLMLFFLYLTARKVNGVCGKC